jgi:signal recognition particle GTPase|tara:strand:+ start:3083 stop:3235 length:153 start_codon:yes stop_codon:yes gene_type:complete
MTEEEYLQTFVREYKEEIESEKEKARQEKIRQGKFTIEEILQAIDEIYSS